MSVAESRQSDAVVSDVFKCALTKNQRKRRKSKLLWLPQGTVHLTKHGGNEIELLIEKARKGQPYRLNAQNLCGLETGRILVPSNKPFCCQKREREESHYVLIALDDNCGDHPIILLTNGESQVIQNWKWHLMNTLAFVNSWPNLDMTFITNEDETPLNQRVTLMLTKTWLSVFKFQKYKLPQLWHRIRIETISDMRYFDDTEEGKPLVRVICQKGTHMFGRHIQRVCSAGTLEILSSRVEEIFTTVDALWRLPLTVPGPRDSLNNLKSDSDNSTCHPRSDDSAPEDISDSVKSAKTDVSDANNKGPGCSVHQPVIEEFMTNQDSSGHISVSCTSCLQSGDFTPENTEKEKPPVPCVGKMTTGMYIDRPYLPMNKISRESMLGSTNAEHLPLSDLKIEPITVTQAVVEVPRGEVRSPPDGVVAAQVLPSLETIQSESEFDSLGSLQFHVDSRSGETGKEGGETRQEEQAVVAYLYAVPEKSKREEQRSNVDPEKVDQPKDGSSGESSCKEEYPKSRQRRGSDCTGSVPKHSFKADDRIRHVTADAPITGRRLRGKGKAATLPAGVKPPRLGDYSHYYSVVTDRKSCDINMIMSTIRWLDYEGKEDVRNFILNNPATWSAPVANQNLYVSPSTDDVPGPTKNYYTALHISPNDKSKYARSKSSPEGDEKYTRGILRRANSLGTPRRTRPTSSLYVYWSATSIVHTLTRILKNKPPLPDTLGLSSTERKELCMRLFTPIVDEGQHDWTALGSHIGLTSESVWLIEAFQSKMNSKDTAAEIVLKHWQFCYNKYGVSEDKCPVPCTRMELIRLLTLMDRNDLITEVLGKRQIYQELDRSKKRPVENLTFDLNTWESDGSQGHVLEGQNDAFMNVDGITVPRENYHGNSKNANSESAESDSDIDIELFSPDVTYKPGIFSDISEGGIASHVIAHDENDSSADTPSAPNSPLRSLKATPDDGPGEERFDTTSTDLTMVTALNSSEQSFDRSLEEKPLDVNAPELDSDPLEISKTQDDVEHFLAYGFSEPDVKPTPLNKGTKQKPARNHPEEQKIPSSKMTSPPVLEKVQIRHKNPRHEKEKVADLHLSIAKENEETWL